MWTVVRFLVVQTALLVASDAFLAFKVDSCTISSCTDGFGLHWTVVRFLVFIDGLIIRGLIVIIHIAF